jgi:GT2 family glycosyltransferase
MSAPAIGAVIIGRNEGSRLHRCLASIPPAVAPVVYVDSGSTDGSPAAARAAGAQVVALDMERPFTAARARNAGFAALRDAGAVDLVQFVDGDCELQPGWIDTAAAFLQANPRAAVVCGRRRERFPEASVWNRLCDREWDTPVGRAQACGGDAMMRADAFAAAGGFDPTLIAGEEPELCVRLRAAGWEVWRIDAEMVLHDAAMTRFSQWWQRMRRSGHAAAEGAAMHGRSPERHGVSQTRRALGWGLALPTLVGLGALHSLWALALLLSWPAQVTRLALHEGAGRRDAWVWAAFITLGKFPEALGILEYHLRRLSGQRRGLIEYKRTTPG